MYARMYIIETCPLWDDLIFFLNVHFIIHNVSLKVQFVPQIPFHDPFLTKYPFWDYIVLVLKASPIWGI